ncbi:MAG: cytochrome-c oxidase, cbb3-type subunit III [Rhodocyclaceae bacterium]|nr:MAG: cytochrome-c oxidase, cbb3-type subunit III [Rhodocyclaceae bacterium]
MDFNNTSDFVSSFWNLWVAGVVLLSILGCGLFLWIQSTAKHAAGQTTGHVWDETLEEYSNPLPNWWRWMFYLTIIFALVYLALYPGLGNNAGSYGWTMRGQYDKEKAVADAQFEQAYGPQLKMDVAAVAADPKAKEAGQRLFLTYCAQCHGADAKGAKGFPNLTDSDWLWGGSPEAIKETILKGRDAMMPAKGLKSDLNADQIKDLANFVRSLSGLASDSLRAQRGKELFAQACAACHGPEGKGNVGVAPNLSDKVWLYGSSEDTIIETITKGRQNRMPAWGDFLGESKVHLLAAYVYGLSNEAKTADASAVEKK